MNTASSRSTSSRHTLRRNLYRNKLGGVCAGIADRLGINPTPVRLFFVALPVLSFVALLVTPLKGILGLVGLLLSPLTFVLTFGFYFLIYLALWNLIPAAPKIPIPRVSSKELEKVLWVIDKAMDKIHHKQIPEIADLAQAGFDAIKSLAPYLDKPDDQSVDKTLRQAALEQFPAFLQRLEGLPSHVALGQLDDFRHQFQQAAQNLIEREFQTSIRTQSNNDSPELAAWREKLYPLRDQLRERSGSQTIGSLSNIEEKLGFLLERIGQGEVLFDVRPFEVRKIAFEYLPDTLNQYLQLPPSMAQTQKLNSGKTAEESLNEQLNLLDTALHDLARSLFEKDAGGLLVHGRFLKEKFAEQPFRLER